MKDMKDAPEILAGRIVAKGGAMSRPKTMAEFERIWLAQGGHVVRDNSGHVVFKFPGIPAGAVHQPRSTGTDRVPRHLLSRLRRIQEGRVVTPPRVIESPITIEPEKIERPRLVQRANPQKPFSIAPHNPAAVEAEAKRLAEQKARDRAAVVNRLINRVPLGPIDPLTRAMPTVRALDFAHDVQFEDARDGRDPEELSKLLLAAFQEAGKRSMVFFFETIAEWTAACDPFLVPDAMARAISGAREEDIWAVAIVKDGEGGLLPAHTYVLPVRMPTLGIELCTAALITTPPAAYARFKVSWACGFDFTEAECRKAGLLNEKEPR